jgi:hypothetical protein
MSYTMGNCIDDRNPRLRMFDKPETHAGAGINKMSS